MASRTGRRQRRRIRWSMRWPDAYSDSWARGHHEVEPAAGTPRRAWAAARPARAHPPPPARGRRSAPRWRAGPAGRLGTGTPERGGGLTAGPGPLGRRTRKTVLKVPPASCSRCPPLVVRGTPTARSAALSRTRSSSAARSRRAPFGRPAPPRSPAPTGLLPTSAVRAGGCSPIRRAGLMERPP